MDVDEPARQRLIQRFGAGVTSWCDGVPGLVAHLAARWDLRVKRSMPGGTSFTLYCLRGDTPVVLKLTLEPGIAAAEHAALLAWAE